MPGIARDHLVAGLDERVKVGLAVCGRYAGASTGPVAFAAAPPSRVKKPEIHFRFAVCRAAAVKSMCGPLGPWGIR
jgi:hypothetical protein